MSTASTSYNASDIVSLEGLEPVRKRPGMYIGSVGAAGLHHLVWEILDNAVDEAMNGYASEIVVTLHKNGHTVTVSDNGRGIPVDKHAKTGKSALEVVLTILHAGGKFEGKNYKTSGGLHGVGASVVNALSKELIAVVRRDGVQYKMEFSQGKPTTKLQKGTVAVRGTGTTITFTPDPTIFPKTDFDAETIRQRLEITSFLHRGVRIQFADDTTGKKDNYFHEQGIVDEVPHRGDPPAVDVDRVADPLEGVEADAQRQQDFPRPVAGGEPGPPGHGQRVVKNERRVLEHPEQAEVRNDAQD